MASVSVKYMDLRTGEEDTVVFTKYGKLMGIAARMGMKRLYGSKWERRYKILFVENLPDKKEVKDAPEIADESGTE